MEIMVALKRADWVVELNVYYILDFGALLRKEDRVNIRQHTSLRQCHAFQQLVQLFIITNGQEKMSWDNPLLFVVASGIASQFQNLCSEILSLLGF